MGRFKKWLSIGLMCLLLVSTGHLLYQRVLYARAEKANAAAVQLASRPARREEPVPEPAGETDPEETAPREKTWVPAPVTEDPWVEELAAMDLAALQEVNPDVIGWIFVPDTPVNFPLLQGEDNETYLHLTWDLQENAAGSIFLECWNDPALTDFHTIVYGHNMLDGSMFHCIENYADADYLAAHPYIYIITDTGVFRYTVFSTYRAYTDSATYGLSFRQEKTRLDFLAMAAEQTVVETAVSPAVTDRILTLSTCSGATYATRWVVHAYLAMVQV